MKTSRRANGKPAAATEPRKSGPAAISRQGRTASAKIRNAGPEKFFTGTFPIVGIGASAGAAV